MLCTPKFDFSFSQLNYRLTKENGIYAYTSHANHRGKGVLSDSHTKRNESSFAGPKNVGILLLCREDPTIQSVETA
jgi:hypothetical protein